MAINIENTKENREVVTDIVKFTLKCLDKDMSSADIIKAIFRGPPGYTKAIATKAPAKPTKAKGSKKTDMSTSRSVESPTDSSKGKAPVKYRCGFIKKTGQVCCEAHGDVIDDDRMIKIKGEKYLLCRAHSLTVGVKKGLTADMFTDDRLIVGENVFKVDGEWVYKTEDTDDSSDYDSSDESESEDSSEDSESE